MRPVLSPYEALSAKVRALYGKRLRYEDFQQLGRCATEEEVLAALRQRPGWARAVEGLEPSPDQYVGRLELENALGGQVAREYRSLLHFLPRRDRALMRFPVLLAERDAILRALRRLKASAAYRGLPHPTRLPPGSAVDGAALEACRDYAGLVDAAAGSIYAPVLGHLRPEDPGALPDYMTTEALLRTAYFAHMFRVVHRQYAGETRELLRRALGRQTDLLNLIHILRIKTYFPGTESLEPLLFPFHDRLRPAFLRELCAAPDAAAAFALIRTSPYAESFQNVDVTEVEDFYRRAFWQFNRQQLLTGAPSVYTAMAYLNLKELEMRALVNVIESVKYGVPYDSAFARLLGA